MAAAVPERRRTGEYYELTDILKPQTSEEFTTITTKICTSFAFYRTGLSSFLDLALNLTEDQMETFRNIIHTQIAARTRMEEIEKDAGEETMEMLSSCHIPGLSPEHPPVAPTTSSRSPVNDTMNFFAPFLENKEAFLKGLSELIQVECPEDFPELSTLSLAFSYFFILKDETDKKVGEIAIKFFGYPVIKEEAFDESIKYVFRKQDGTVKTYDKKILAILYSIIEMRIESAAEGDELSELIEPLYLNSNNLDISRAC